MKKYRRVMTHENEEWYKEKLILKKYAFFVGCNRLKATLNEVYFTVNLHSFPPTPGPPVKLFLPQGKLFAPVPSRTTSKTSSSFLC